MAGLSEEDQAKYSSLFEDVVRESEDQNGELNMEDFERLLIKCGHRLTRESVVSLFVSTDTDGDWKIRHDEFLEFVSRVAPSGSAESITAAIRRKFDENDINKDGYISFEELQIVLGAVNLQVDEEWVRTFMNEHDTDGDGRMNFEEFVAMYVRTELLDVDADEPNEQEKQEMEAAVTQLTDIFVSADGIRQICHERGLVEDGSVSVDALRSVLSEVRVQMSEENLERAIQTLDRNEDGNVNLDEFVIKFEDVTTLETEEQEEREVNGNVEEEQTRYEEPQEQGNNEEVSQEPEPSQLTEAYTEPEQAEQADRYVEEEPAKFSKASYDEEMGRARRNTDTEVSKLSQTFEGKKTSRQNSCGDDGAHLECKGVGVKALIAKWSK